MPDSRDSERTLRDAADRNDRTVPREDPGERSARTDLGRRRPAVRRRAAGMRRHDVPEQHVFLESELEQRAVDDRRGRLGRPLARELPLRRERDARHARASVPGRLPHEQDASVGALVEVGGKPFAKKGGARPLRVLVERSPDPRRSEPVHESATRYDGASVTGSSGSRAERADESAADPQNLIWVMPAEEGVSEEIVVVVSGGAPPVPRAALEVPLGAPVIAADEGLEHALALGLEVTVAVGDFDSASPEAVAVAEASETRVERHPPDKDATDLELALDLAATMSPARILVLAGDGGRLDHLLASLLLLGSDRYAGSQVDAFIGGARVHVIRAERSLEGTPGELVSLLPCTVRRSG